MRGAAVWLALMLTLVGCACARQMELSVLLHSRTSRDVYKVKLRASSGRRARAPTASTGPERSLLAEHSQPLPGSGSNIAAVGQVLCPDIIIMRYNNNNMNLHGCMKQGKE